LWYHWFIGGFIEKRAKSLRLKAFINSAQRQSAASPWVLKIEN